MKRLKFKKKLIPLILSGQKTSTWRVFDEKNINKGDELSLVDTETGKEFARAKVHVVKETTFGQLDNEDKAGHEAFPDEKEMLKTYSGYYNHPLDNSTRLKVIRFRLMK